MVSIIKKRTKTDGTIMMPVCHCNFNSVPSSLVNPFRINLSSKLSCLKPSYIENFDVTC